MGLITYKRIKEATSTQLMLFTLTEFTKGDMKILSTKGKLSVSFLFYNYYEFKNVTLRLKIIYILML